MEQLRRTLFAIPDGSTDGEELPAGTPVDVGELVSAPLSSGERSRTLYVYGPAGERRLYSARQSAIRRALYD